MNYFYERVFILSHPPCGLSSTVPVAVYVYHAKVNLPQSKFTRRLVDRLVKINRTTPRAVRYVIRLSSYVIRTVAVRLTTLYLHRRRRYDAMSNSLRREGSPAAPPCKLALIAPTCFVHFKTVFVQSTTRRKVANDPRTPPPECVPLFSIYFRHGPTTRAVSPTYHAGTITQRLG